MGGRISRTLVVLAILSECGSAFFPRIIHRSNCISALQSTRNAGRYIELYKGDVNAAMSTYISEKVASLRKVDEPLWEAIVKIQRVQMLRAQLPKASVLSTSLESQLADAEHRLRELLSSDSSLERRAHSKLVEFTWDTIAVFIDQNNKSPYAAFNVDSLTRKKLSAVSAAATSGVEPLRVLDVGCGTGLLSDSLRSKGVSVEDIVGIDLSMGMIQLAQAAYPKSAWIQGDFLTCPAKEASFSAVVFNGALQFFPDQVEALHKAKRLLRPGGVAVISHVNGPAFVVDEHTRNPSVVPHPLPTREQLATMAHALGMRLQEHGPYRSGKALRPDSLYLEVLEL